MQNLEILKLEACRIDDKVKLTAFYLFPFMVENESDMGKEYTAFVTLLKGGSEPQCVQRVQQVL